MVRGKLRFPGVFAAAIFAVATAICGAGIGPNAAFALPFPPRTSTTRNAATQPSTATPNNPTSPAISTTEPVSPPIREPGLLPFGFTGPSPIIAPSAPSSDFLPIPDRWRIGFPPDYRQNTRGSFLDPYHQNVLKGDYPIIGQNIFLDVTVTSDTLFEARQLPTPSGVSAAKANSFPFFGEGRQQLISENFIVSIDLFQGDAGYKPRDWDLRITPVFNENYIDVSENAIVNPDVREGRNRSDSWIGFQELFVEKRLADLSPNFDFVSVRAGIQGFTSDFRGFLFSDNEPGVRLFGNLDDNRIQWNLSWFHTLEKDTNSGLNSYTLRDQNVFIGNVYKQDFLFSGYTTQLSLQTNLDGSADSDHPTYDTNGVLVRPAPIGTIHSNDVDAYYLGWAGDGHIGRFNITHQFYEALGHESYNPIAGHDVNINAQFAAIEISYDQDFLRYRASFAYASGDGNPTSHTATGFDSIFDNPNFAGGDFDFFTREAIKLTGAGVNLVNHNSLLPDLRTSKEQGQANFVNPGLLLYNVGVDAALTPKLKLITNVSYLQFDTPASIQMILHDNKVSRDIGVDYSVGVEYRPFLNNNTIINVGATALTPMNGFKALYGSSTLYSIFTGITLTY